MSAAFDFRKCKRLLLSSLAVSALYRGPRGILCTRGEKEYASIRQPTAACDNRLVKNEAYDDSPRKFICAEDVDGRDVNGAARHRAVLRYIAKRHKVSAKINTLHNARKRKRFPNANLWLGSCPVSHKQKTHNQIGCAFLLVDVNGLEPLTFSTSRRHSTS